MKQLELINQKDGQYAQKVLNEYYQNDMIPAEKKTYLAKYSESVGPFLAVETDDQNNKPHYLLDLASQIATLGLGFNSAVKMGTTQFLSAWTGDTRDQEFQKLQKAHHQFIARKVGHSSIHLHYCHSGAEAAEIALGKCYQTRKNKEARKVICFEGSFHGRMLVSLFSSWNKSKREPFEIEELKSIYLPFADIKAAVTSESLNPTCPQDWEKVWDMASLKNFSLPESWSNQQNADLQLQKEIQALLKLREQLLKKEAFAIIVEPMQCEGGDKYATSRYFSAILLIARAFEIPVIFDEVQTGFHLGREFFWHRQLKLRDIDQKELFPDYITCAKKAQVGMVIEINCQQNAGLSTQEYNPASLIRGHLHALALDQSRDKIIQLEKYTHTQLQKIAQEFSSNLENPRINGLAFSLDLKEEFKNKLNDIINLRFDYGLLYYPAGERTLRFRLNLAFDEQLVDFTFSQLHAIFKQTFQSGTLKKQPHLVNYTPPHQIEFQQWQIKLLQMKYAIANNQFEETKEQEELLHQLVSYFKKQHDLDLSFINQNNYQNFESMIEKIEQRNYEPARQTDIENFKKAAHSKKGICLALMKSGELVGLCCSAPLYTLPFDRGVRIDPYFNSDHALYVMDATIDHSLQGKGLGRMLKMAATLIATSHKVERLQGRNRDQIAQAMLKINLSLGAYPQAYFEDDYKDEGQNRDVIYYTLPLQWTRPPLNLSNLNQAPLDFSQFDQRFFDDQFFTLTNKICLSNFVSQNFLQNMKDHFMQLDPSLRHGYSASGQSEAVDKIAKSIWLSQKKTNLKRPFKMISFKNHYFGAGSFLSRSLSGIQPYFDTCLLDDPAQVKDKLILSRLKEELEKEALAVWIEPVPRYSLHPISKQFLIDIKQLCQRYKTPLIYNETYSSFYRYSDDNFYAGLDAEITPDAQFVYMAGQSALIALKKDYFIADPLMMISTWDGDEYSLVRYQKAKEWTQKNHQDFVKEKKQFHQNLTHWLSQFNGIECHVKNGTGYFTGALPKQFWHLFHFQTDRFIVNPTYMAMKDFNQKFQTQGLSYGK